MKVEILSRSRFRQHAATLAVPAMIATLSGVQVASQFREDFGATNGRRLGTTVRTEGEVLKRSTRSFRWYDMRAAEDLIEKTSIKTSENSEVALQFRDGSTVNLGPQAFVVLGSAADGVTRLKVVRGEVRFKAKTKMQIEAGGQTLESAQSSGRVDVTHGTATTSLTEGTGEMLTLNSKQPLALAAGSIAMLGVDGNLTTQGLAPEKTSTKAATPSGDFKVFPYELKGTKKMSTRLSARENLKVIKLELSWMPVEGATEYTVEFLNSHQKVVTRKTTPISSLLLDIKKTSEFERSYRILTKVGDREFRSDVLKYSIELAAPTPVNPPEGARWSAEIMSWECTLLTDSYELQIAQDRAFKQAETLAVPYNFWTYRNKARGTYYWKIRANVGGRKSPWSEVRTFVRE